LFARSIRTCGTARTPAWYQTSFIPTSPFADHSARLLSDTSTARSPAMPGTYLRLIDEPRKYLKCGHVRQ
jgi:hypothetical protein